MKCIRTLFLSLFCLLPFSILAENKDVPLFETLEEKVAQSKEQKNTVSLRSGKTTESMHHPNIGKKAKTGNEIKIAPFRATTIPLQTPDAKEMKVPFGEKAPSAVVQEEETATSLASSSNFAVRDIRIVSSEQKKNNEENTEKGESLETFAPTLKDGASIEAVGQFVQQPIVIEKPAYPLFDSLPDVTKFDVMGIKLYMNPEEIVEIGSDNGFGVARVVYAIPTFMTSDFEKQCRKEGLVQVQLIHDCVRNLAQDREVYYISELRLENKTTKEQIVASFVSGLTQNQAYRIDYTAFGDNSLGTSYKDIAQKSIRKETFWKLVFAKYGNPNFSNKMLWGDPRNAYMQVFMEKNSLDGRIIIDDKEFLYKDMDVAVRENQDKESSYLFSFYKTLGI